MVISVLRLQNKPDIVFGFQFTIFKLNSLYVESIASLLQKAYVAVGNGTTNRISRISSSNGNTYVQIIDKSVCVKKESFCFSFSAHTINTFRA